MRLLKSARFWLGIMGFVCMPLFVYLTFDPPAVSPACWNHDTTGQRFCELVTEFESLPDGHFTVEDIQTYGPGGGATLIWHGYGPYRTSRVAVLNRGQTMNWPAGIRVGDRFRVVNGRAYL
jgi:hypothetical protein